MKKVLILLIHILVYATPIFAQSNERIGLAPETSKLNMKRHKHRFNESTHFLDSAKIRRAILGGSLSNRFAFPKKSFSEILPGIYISQYEVTNYEMCYFNRPLVKQNSYSKPWTSYLTELGIPYHFRSDMDKYYFLHPAFEVFPSNTINPDQAELYCEWLNLNETNFIGKKIKFRLPTIEEWLIAYGDQKTYEINAKDTLAFANLKLRNNDSCGCNYINVDKSLFTNRVCSYPPNNYGLYDMAGNVSEIVKTDGKYYVIGSNWDRAYTSDQKSYFEFKEKSATTGFRIVMEIIK
jgi:hypothetical protein